MALPPPPSPSSAPVPSSPPAPSPSSASPAARRRVGPIAAIAAVVGIGVGLVIGAVAFGGDDGEPTRAKGAAADAAAGCGLLAGLPDEIPERLEGDEWSIDGPNTWRLQAASGAFVAASKDGREYRSLGDDGDALYRGLQRLDVDASNEALTNLRGWCEEHDLGDG